MVRLAESLHEVKVEPKRLDDYIDVAGFERIDRLRELAMPLEGKKLLQINATAYGGGVAELLRTQVALLKDLGLQVEWRVMEAMPEFYDVTKIFHNTLQGAPGTLSAEQKAIYLDTVRENAEKLSGYYDFILIHDPQPLAMIDFTKPTLAKWIWRCHIDTSEPNPGTWDFLYPYMKQYDAVVFTLDEFVKEGVEFNNLTFIPPSIDPLSPKNKEMDMETARKIISRFNIDLNRPLMTQVSRFDPWKDPYGILEIYKDIKANYIPDLQLGLIGSMAHDDPEGWIIYDRILRKAGEDYDVHVYSNFHGIGDLEVKAFQTASDVILQKSIKEGFGLTVSEALWKGKPVIGGKVGGIKIQIEDGVNGFLVSNLQEAREKTLYLLEHPKEAEKMGRAGKEIVRNKFITIREIEDHLKLLNKLLY